MRQLLKFSLFLFLVQYSVSEKCYECLERYAVYCSGTLIPDDCGLPYKTAIHYEQFDTMENTLRYLNGDNVPSLEWTIANGPVITVVGQFKNSVSSNTSNTLQYGRYLPDNATDVQVYELKKITVAKEKVGTITVTEQQPVKVIKDKLEWRVVQP